LKVQVFVILTSLCFMTIIINMVRKEYLDIKYSLTWLFVGVAAVIISIQPKIIFAIANFIGILLPSNAIFLFGILFIALITFSLTIALSRQSFRIRKMAQEMALLEKKIENKEKVV